MRALLMAFAYLISTGVDAGSTTIKSGPDYRFAWNQFTTVATVDSVAILAGPEGVLSAVYNNTTDRFVPSAQLLSFERPRRIIVDDNLVAIVFENGRTTLIDRTALPQLVVKGQIDLPDTSLDIRIHNGWIYIAAGFRGLLYAPLVDNERLGPLDSSQIGVHLLSLDILGDRLVTADDYNGLLEYKLQADGSPVYVSQLNLPFQCTNLDLMGDTALLARRDEDSLLLAVRDSIGWSLRSAGGLPFGCQSVYVMDTFVIAVSRDLAGFTALTRRSLSVVNSAANQSGRSLLYPAKYGSAGSTRLVVPGQSGGLLQYWLDWFDVSSGASEAYFPSGAINSLTFSGNWLVAGGASGWCHAYYCGDSPVPDTEIVVFDQFGIVAEVQATNQGVAILNSVTRKVNLTKDNGSGPRPFATFFLGHPASRMFWSRTPIDSYTPVFIWSGQDGYLYRFSEDNQLEFMAHFAVPISMKSAVIIDSLLIVSAAKSELLVYRIFPDFTLAYRSTLSVPVAVELLIDIPTWPSSVAAVGGDQFSRVILANPHNPTIDTTITLPLTIWAACVDDSMLYMTGPESTAVWSLSPDGSLPNFLGATPFGGHSVSGNGEFMAVTNGKAIYTFDLRGPTDVGEPDDLLPSTSSLLINYPNPFNPATVIAYDITSPGDISLVVYNALGQKVRSLEETYRTTGRYQIEWDGRDDDNRPVASGTYFCRLSSRDFATTGKMMLVR